MRPLAEFVRQTPQFVVAHRGVSAAAPENTIAAFQRAIEANIPMIELDVQLSRDQELVVIHDFSLDRTTNGSGAVHHHTMEQLEQLDAGSWFAPEFAGQRILRLSEALDLLLPHCYLNIEIKPPAIPDHFPLKVQRAAELVQQRQAFPFVLFSSFHYPSLQWLTTHFPEAQTAPIRFPKDRTAPSQLVRCCNAAVFVADLESITADDVADFQRHQLYAAYYTINSEAALERALQQQVTAIVSDNAVYIQQLLHQWQHK